MEIYMYFWYPLFVSFGHIPRSGIAESYGSSINFLRNFILFSVWLYEFTFPPTRFSVSLHPCQHLLTLVVLIKVISPVWCRTLLWFWFAFSWWLVILSTFLCNCWPFGCLIWKMYASFLCHFSYLQYCILFRYTAEWFNIFITYTPFKVIK